MRLMASIIFVLFSVSALAERIPLVEGDVSTEVAGNLQKASGKLFRKVSVTDPGAIMCYRDGARGNMVASTYAFILAKATHFNELYDRKYKQLISQGMSPVDAQLEMYSVLSANEEALRSHRYLIRAPIAASYCNKLLENNPEEMRMINSIIEKLRGQQ